VGTRFGVAGQPGCGRLYARCAYADAYGVVAGFKREKTWGWVSRKVENPFRKFEIPLFFIGSSSHGYYSSANLAGAEVSVLAVPDRQILPV
jgi:hypothetical protein